MGKLVCPGKGTKDDPLRYVVNQELIDRVRRGEWNIGMLDALADFAERHLEEEVHEAK